MKQQTEEMERKSNLSSTLVNNDSLNMLLGNNLSLKNDTNIPSSLTTLETVPRSVVSDVFKVFKKEYFLYSSPKFILI